MITRRQKPPLNWTLIAVFAIVSGLMLIVGFRYTGIIKERILNNRKDELKYVTDMKVAQLVQWKQERLGDAIVIQNNTALVSQIDNFLYVKGKSEKGSLNRWMKSILNSYDYLNAGITDSTGKVRLSIPDTDSIIGPKMRSLIPGVLKSRQILLTDLHQAAPGQMVHMDLIVPLVSEEKNIQKTIGLFILRIDPEKLLYPLINSWPTQSRTSETLILRREGDSLIYLNEPRHLSSPLFTIKRSVKEENLVGAKAVIGTEGSITGFDYRKVPVLAEVRKIKELNWYMVSEVDLREVNSQISDALTLIRLLIVFFISAFGAVIGWTIWHQRVRFYRERYESELEREALAKHFNYILKYANDIILLIDPDLVIVEANDTAIEVYKYTRKELLGLSIYKLRLPEYNSQLDEKMSQINETSSATYETVHRRKDGTTFPIEISARLFEIEGKKYYQSIGRDITERKSIEARLNQMIDRYNMASIAAKFAVWEYDLVNDRLIWDDRVYELYGVKREDFAPVYKSWLETVHPEDRESADKVIRDSIIEGEDYSTEFRIILPDGSEKYIKAFGHIAKG